MKEVSRYKNNVIASGKKHIFSILTDYFITFILTFLVFTIFYPISMTNGYGKSIANEMDNIVLSANEYVGQTHLRTFDSEKKTLSNVNEDAVKYIENVTKTSAFVYDLPFPIKKSDGTYDTEHRVTLQETFLSDPTNYSLDNLSYYFLKFKPTVPSINNYKLIIDGSEVDLKDDKVRYQYLEVMKYKEFTLPDSIFIAEDSTYYQPYKDDVPRYVILQKDLAEKFISKIAYNETKDAETENTYTSFKNCYNNALQFGCNELENKCEPYMNLNNQYLAVYEKLTLFLFMIMSICYVASYVLLVVVFRLINKQWTTIGMRVFKLGFTDKDEMEPDLRLIPYHILCAVLYFSSILIGLFLSGLLGVLKIKLFGPITLFMVIAFVLTLGIISLIFCGFNKNHLSLINLICGLQVKDTTQVEGPVEEVIENGQN